jgi:hypothetical protein
MAWQRRNAPYVGLVAALAAAAALLIALGWPLTFFQDTWAILLERPGFSADSLLRPHNEHLVVFQVALEKLLIKVFGMTSSHPEMLVMTGTLLASAALLFAYVRRRVDPWLALMATVLLLFLGAAWQVQLWPFEIEFSAPIAAGLGVLLLLDREDARADAWACLLMIIGLGFGSLGLSFVFAAAVDVFLKRDRRGWGRAWIVIVPLVLYAVWYVGWGRDAEHHLTLHNILLSPQYLFNGLAAAVGSLSGLDTIGVSGQGDPTWGRPLLIVLIGLAVYWQRRRPGVATTFWPVVVASLSYWLLAAFNFIPGREATSSRYIYAGAVFVILLAAELLRGVRVSRQGLLIAGAVTLLAVAPNLTEMKDGANFLKEQSVLTRADTAAIEIASHTVEPSFALTPEIAGTPSLININAEKLLPVARENGSPAYSPQELTEAPASGQRQADIVLSQALPLATDTRPGSLRPASGRENCVEAGGSAPGQEVRLSPGKTRIEVAPGGQAGFSLRRFAVGEYPVPTAGAPGESTTILEIPRDKAPQPWYLLVEAAQTAWVCR